MIPITYILKPNLKQTPISVGNDVFARGDLESRHFKFQELDILLIQAPGLIPTAR